LTGTSESQAARKTLEHTIHPYNVLVSLFTTVGFGNYSQLFVSKHRQNYGYHQRNNVCRFRYSLERMDVPTYVVPAVHLPIVQNPFLLVLLGFTLEIPTMDTTTNGNFSSKS
jgi:hypothetical protein